MEANVLRGFARLHFAGQDRVLKISWRVVTRIQDRHGKELRGLLTAAAQSPFEHAAVLSDILAEALAGKGCGPALSQDEILEEACAADFDDIAKALFESMLCKPWSEIQAAVEAQHEEPEQLPLPEVTSGDAHTE